MVRLTLIEHTDPEIDATTVEILEDAMPVRCVQKQLHTRRDALQAGDKLRHEQHLRRVGNAKRERDVGRCGIESGLSRRQLLDLRECCPHGG